MLFELTQLGRQAIATLRVELRLLHPVGPRAGQLLGVAGHVRVLARDLFGLAHRLLHIAFGARRLRPPQLALHLLQPFGGRGRLCSGAGVVARGGLPHGVGGLLHLPRRCGEVGAVLLARQLLELPCRLLGLFGERPLLIAAAAGRLSGRAPALPLEFLLLATRQLLQLLGQRVDLLFGLAALGPRRRLVLVGHLVHFELEQVRQVFRDRSGLSPAAPAARLPAGLHLRLVLFFGLLQVLQCLLLGGHRAVRAPHLQLGFGGFHFGGCERQHLGDLLEGRVGGDQAGVHAAHEPFDLLAQAPLRQRQHDRALAQLLGREPFLFAQHVERAGDDLALLLRQRTHVRATTTAPAAASAGLRGRRLELLAKRPHAQEVHVARGLLAAARVVVVGARVVGHGVARLHAEFFEIERVAGGDLFEARGAAVEGHRLLGAAVHRVDQFETAHAEVVVGAGLDHELLHRRGRGVAAGLGNRHGGRHVREHVDHVLRRGGDHRAVGPLQADAVEAVLVGHEHAGERALGPDREWHLRGLVQRELAGGRGHGRRDRDDHLGAGEHRDVAGVFDDAWFEAGVGGEAVFEVDALRVGQIHDVEREGAGSHTRGLGHELELRVQVEDHAFERAGVALDHRHALERGGVALAHQQHRVVGGEAAQRGGEELVGAARHCAGAGRERDAIRRRRLETRRPREHRRQALTQVGGPEREHRQGEGHGAGRHQAVAPHERLVDAPPGFDLVAALDGRFDELGHERR